MNEKTIKLQRTSVLLKGLMALAAFLLGWQIFQTNVIDFGEVAATIGTLSLLRGLLLSPSLLAVPFKLVLSKNSYPYFLLAVILFAVSAF